MYPIITMLWKFCANIRCRCALDTAHIQEFPTRQAVNSKYQFS